MNIESMVAEYTVFPERVSRVLWQCVHVWNRCTVFDYEKKQTGC